MNILVCTALSFPDLKETLPKWEHPNHTFWATCWGQIPPDFRPDIIIGMGIGAMEETFAALERWPKANFYAYNWDTYAWVWTHPRPGEYDYKRYGELLKRAREIWVPSICTHERTEEFYGLQSKVILSSIPRWEPPCDVGDDNFVLCTLREIPDPYCSWFEEACNKLDIPFTRTNHECSWDTYREHITRCSFIVSHYYEASTGGLSCLEAYRLGKPVLLSNSRYHGGCDYFQGRARYFIGNDFDNFCFNLKDLWTLRPQLNAASCKEWVDRYYTSSRMVSDMLERIIS